MTKIVAYMPTYSPESEASNKFPRPYTRLDNQSVFLRTHNPDARVKPALYMDCIDSILNIRPDIRLVVADAKSTDSIREGLIRHHKESALPDNPTYILSLYPEKESQWKVFNDIFKNDCDAETEYFVYTSSDIIWTMDWINEAIKEFDKDPKLQIIFPCFSRGDGNLPCQIAPSPRDIDLIVPPYLDAARAPVLNMYACIFRISFLETYGGYPDVFRNCYSESFLHSLCEAVGGYMRVMPRGWVFHYGSGDIWGGKSPYYYFEEKSKFGAIMDDLEMARAMGAATPNYMKKLLYKDQPNV